LAVAAGEVLQLLGGQQFRMERVAAVAAVLVLLVAPVLVQPVAILKHLLLPLRLLILTQLEVQELLAALGQVATLAALAQVE
jgi:hypothetical protein